MNTPEPTPTAPQPVLAPAIPFYKNPAQIAMLTTAITGFAAAFPKAGIVTALNLGDAQAVSTLVSQIFASIAAASLVFGIVAQWLSKLHPMTATAKQALSSTATQAVIQTQTLMKAANVPLGIEAKQAMDASKSNGTPTVPPLAVLFMLVALSALAVPLAGCATTGATAAPGQTFEQIVTTAASADDVALKTIGNLAASRVLTSDQATTGVKVTDAIHAALNLAQVSYSAGDETTAESKIAAAAAALAQVQVCIATGAKVPIATCLAGVTAP